MACSAPQWLTDILEDECFLKYHSYYMTRAHNHKAHGIVALAYLGASEERVLRYCDVCNKSGLPVMDGDKSNDAEQEIDFLKSENIEDYKGKNQAFYKILAHFTKLYKEKYKEDYVALIEDIFPEVADGPMLAAFHGVIQTAYGMVGNSPQVVLEGITTTFHQYSPFLPDDLANPKRTDLSKFGHGQTEILDTFEELRLIPGFVQQLDSDSVKDKQYRIDTHMFGIYGWGGWKYHSEKFLDMTDNIMLPDWFDTTVQEKSQLIKLINWSFDMAAVAYVKSEVVNDFFLLHGMTAAWSLKQVLPHLNYTTGLAAIRAHWCALLMVYVNQGSPKLNRKPEDFWEGTVTQAVWDKVIKDTFAGDYETHVFKVVQVCYNRWTENPHTEYADYLIAAADISRAYQYGTGTQNNGMTLPNTEGEFQAKILGRRK